MRMREERMSITAIVKAYGIHRNTSKHYLDDIKL